MRKSTAKKHSVDSVISIGFLITDYSLVFDDKELVRSFGVLTGSFWQHATVQKKRRSVKE